MRIPEKYKKLFPANQKGEKVDRLISFVDLVPTLLSIAGVEIPEYLQGNAFLGEQKTENPEYAYMFRGRMDERYDMSRAVRGKQFRYIRNYMPHRIYGQPLEYLFKAPSVGSWREAYDQGECNQIQSAFWEPKPVEELYDTENDPWEINNLATNPKYTSVLNRMRQANQVWMKKIKDTGFIPEPEQIERTGKKIPMYDYMRSGATDIEKIQAVAELASSGNSENINQFISLLKNEDSAIRYWAATGLLILGEKARPATAALKTVLDDSSEVVSAVAAESLFILGEKEVARKALLNILTCNNSFARCQALNTIDCLDDSDKTIQQGVIKLLQNAKNASRKDYDIRAARGLMLKWKLNPKDYQINLSR